MAPQRRDRSDGRDRPGRPEGRRPATSAPDRPVRPDRPRPERPDFPEGAKPRLPAPVRRELRGVVRGRLAEDVALALTVASEAIEEELPDVALPYLTWAKAVASRAPSIREALGVAHYLAENFREALNELRAYRRLSGSLDQEHLVADCLRALDHPVSEVADTVEQMLAADVPDDRKIEGLIVWAAAVADSGDLAAARAVLRRVDRDVLARAEDEARHRYAYVVGDLADRAGDHETAAKAWAPLAAIDGDPYEITDRMESRA